jgi:TolB-like protein/Tfp pilus assembly protein PilF
MGLTSGTKLGPYEIQSPLGAGGMGEVYRATDTKLGRDVALKVLPAEMAQDPERLGRFRREAKTLAQLDHPNIVTIYSVEECNGVHFLTMQLVEGLALDGLIPGRGLALAQIIEIASALGDALAAAHEKGIVHRDLKPANVMVSNDGRVKVLDFGLAKDIRATNLSDATMTSDSRTQIGVVMGTPAYMSPEQTSGRPLDHRTDIFSLGVLLHEMATGRRPFEGTSSAELVSAILRDTPPSVTDARPDLPSDLARIVRRCLEKDPRHRVQTARDVSNEFRDLARQSSQKVVPSKTSFARDVAAADSGGVRAALREDEGFWVAVLPFKYSGNNADLVALAEGLTDDIVTNMSKFSYLRMIARSSTAQYAQRSVDVRMAAKELGARYVMEGSIRQAGAKVRIAVQLVDANTGAGLWAEAYDRPFSAEATLDILDEVVPRIVATVGDAQGVLAHSMTESLRNRDPESLTPYEALLRSFGFHLHVSASEHLAGITALERAVKQAPDRADCWAMLSWLYRAEYTHEYNARPDPMERSLAAAQRAVNLAPSSQLAHAALASAFFFRRELGAFRSAAERALSLNQMQGYTTAFMGLHFAYSGDWERGCALCEHSTQLNPSYPGWYWLPPAIDAYRQHAGDRALEYALKINMPGLWTAQVALAIIHAQLGHQEQARTAVRDLLALRPDFATVARRELQKWWLPDMVDQMLTDLHKAGLGKTETTAAPGLSSGIPVGRTASGSTRADEGFWVAVLPFKCTSTNADLKALAEGLSEEVVTGLSRFSYLRVIARGSTAKYSSESGDVGAIGKELRTRYVMEGSMRQAGAKLRLAVQLVDTISGAHLWAETYERAFTPESVFEVQDDLVPRIVSTVADQHGVLPRRISEELRVKNEEDLTPHEAVLCAFSFLQRISPTEHATARRILERAVERDPNQADAWAMLAIMYDTEFADEYNLRPHPLERATAAAQRAVDLAPTHALGYYALAFTHFFRKDHAGFRGAVEQAMALNPMDGSVMGLLGLLVHHSGEIKRGTQMVEAAMQLNPHYPPVFRAPAFLNAYAQGKYGEALELAVRFNMPGFFHAHALRAAALGQLGQREAGQQAVQELLAARPDFATTVRRDYGKWWDAKTVDHLVEGLRKAGLPIADGDSKPAPLSATASPTSSGESRSDEGFWVAVLPFKFTGNNADLKSLAEGLSEEVITGLSRFSYLRVIARGSTAKYSSESGDIRAIGKELGARYVMEASQRQAGSKLRLAVQLVDAVSGAHLWAETYERTFSAETVFELQDDLVPRIVSTVADQYGVLPRSMSEVLRNKKDEDLTPQEAVLRAFSYFTRITADEHAVVRRILERAVHDAPDHADSWAMLSMIYRGEFAQGYNAGPNPLDRALAAAQRAVDLAPTHALGHYSLATVHFFRKEMIPFRVEAERAFALNPLDASVKAYLGLLTAASGEWDRGCKIVESAMQLNPNCPGYFYFAGCCNAYRVGKYEEVLEGAARVNMPSYFHVHALRAAALGQLDRREEAQKAVYALLALRPDFAAVARQEYAKWYSPELIEHIVDGLRKAGLEIPDDARPISSGALTATPSIAVLPFANMSDDKEQDYFSDGLAEEIINLLAQIQRLKVIARTSAFAFRGKEQDIRGIAETLGVSTILEGSVRRSGSRIRVTAQLINATDGSHLWSERYDRELSDIFAVQDEISAAIAKALRVKLSREAIPQRYPPKVEAYEAYLKARYQQAKVSPESMELARRFYEQASALDPGFAMPHVGLGFYWHNLANFGRHFAVDCIAPARAEAQRALQIDSSLAEAHALLGYLAAIHDLDWVAAEKHFDFPVAKQVGFGLLRPLYAWVQFWQGKVEPAINLAQRAMEEDPLEVWAHMNLHAYLQGAGRDDEALEQLKKVIELDPNQVIALVSMAMIYADKGNLTEALKIARRAYAIGPWSPDTIGVLAGLMRRNGGEVESSLANALGSGEAPGDARAHALFHLLCGEIDEGADWVEKAVAQRDSSMMVYLRYVVSKSLRASHRWPPIAKMINLPVQPSTLLAG